MGFWDRVCGDEPVNLYWLPVYSMCSPRVRGWAGPYLGQVAAVQGSPLRRGGAKSKKAVNG